MLVVLDAEPRDLGVDGGGRLRLRRFDLGPLLFRRADDVESTSRQHASDRIEIGRIDITADARRLEGDRPAAAKRVRNFRPMGGFKRDMRALVAWLQTHRIQQVVMESTGIYWKSVFGHLEAAGIPALVVNAFHVKNVPGRKTDVGDSEWLAQLARFGLLRGSFIPPKDLRELRIVSRYRRKLTGMLAGEKNRLHKLLDDAGIKLGGVVADIDGVCASKMVEGLIASGKPGELAALGRGKVRAITDILEAAMDGELSARHRLVLDMAYDHLRYLEGKLAALDRYLLAAMQPYAWAWRLLQTIPGIDAVSAAMILIEIGDDPHRFGSPARLASWSALCPGNNESAGKRKSGKTRHGNPIVRYLLCEAANAAKANQDRLPRQVREPGHSPRPQENDHRPRPQTGADHLLRPCPAEALSRLDCRLRSCERRQERPTLDPSPQEIWVLATGRRSKPANRGDRKLILPARRTAGFGARQYTVAARKGLPVTTSVMRIAERDEAAVLSLAYFLTPFTVTIRQQNVLYAALNIYGPAI